MTEKTEKTTHQMVHRCSPATLSELKRQRQSLKLRMRDVAALTGLHYNTIYYLENGLKRPKTSTLRALRTLYQRRLEWKQSSPNLSAAPNWSAPSSTTLNKR